MINCLPWCFTHAATLPAATWETLTQPHRRCCAAGVGRLAIAVKHVAQAVHCQVCSRA